MRDDMLLMAELTQRFNSCSVFLSLGLLGGGLFCSSFPRPRPHSEISPDTDEHSKWKHRFSAQG